jgi:formylglycine-generating enzyme required for sulfatase activity
MLLVVAACGGRVSGTNAETGTTSGSGSSGGSSGSSNAGALPPSCAPGGPGMSDCGTNRENCCTSPYVARGTFYRSYDDTDVDGGVFLASDGGPAGETDPATVSTFRLDTYAVTVGRFRQFVRAWNAGYTPRAGSGKHTHLNDGNGLAATAGGYEPGWLASDDVKLSPTDATLACSPLSTWTAFPGSHENLPIACVNWYESYAFCIWDGGFLPSEAEWEYAAAGGDQQREYPWGSAAPGTANEYAIFGSYYACSSGTCASAGAPPIAPVGTATRGAGRWGQLDLAGNVWQWNMDWSTAYVPCTDCVDVTPLAFRGSRGGYFGGSASYLLVSWRGGGPPTFRGPGLGFRCARSP